MTQKNSERKRTTAQLSAVEWRVRKQKRREKQRHANGVRALKMGSARLESDLVPRPVEKLSKFNIGCSGWFYWHWRQAFYPGDLPTKDWFSYYAANFRTVELNAPFYSWPTINTVKAWLRQAETNDFVSTVKVSELINQVFGSFGALQEQKIVPLLRKAAYTFSFHQLRCRNSITLRRA